MSNIITGKSPIELLKGCKPISKLVPWGLIWRQEAKGKLVDHVEMRDKVKKYQKNMEDFWN